MKSSRLNLASLRKLRASNRISHSPESLLDTDSSLRVSRRSVLGLAGLAASLLPSPLRAAGTSLLGNFSMRTGDGFVVFSLRGKERWLIDCAAFGGTPRLRVEQSDAAIVVELSGAVYPGTTIPADLLCTLTPGVSGTRMELRLAFGGFRCSVPFEQWLLGSAQAFASVSPSHRFEIASGSVVQWQGRSVAYFKPDNSCAVEGSAVAVLLDNGALLAADRTELLLLNADDESLLAQPGKKRSLLVLSRGEQVWALQPRTVMPEGWAFVADDTAFCSVRVECSERRSGVARRAMVAEGAATTGASVEFAGLSTDTGQPFRLPLRSVRYAVSFGKQYHSALLAEFAPGNSWMQLGDCSFRFGPAETVKLFEIICVGGVLQSMNCAPALLGVVAPLAGVVVQPVQIASPMPVAFVPAQNVSKGLQVQDVAKELQTEGRNNKTLQDNVQTEFKVRKRDRNKLNTDIGKLQLGVNFRIAVLRPEDLLSLEFEFFNFQLQTGASGRAQLSRDSSAKPAYIIVHFQPQSIAEEAFFDAGNIAPPPAPPGNADPDKNSSTERPTAPPVKALLSGPSRLVFRVPESVQSLPYTLDSLLDWRQYTMNVASTALPPPTWNILEILEEREFWKFNGDVTVNSSKVKDIVQSGGSLSGEGSSGGTSKSSLMSLRELRQKTVFNSGGTGSIKQLLQDNPSLIDRVSDRERRKLDPGVVSDGILVPLIPRPEPPAEQETAIEAPYRLILSPNIYGAWAHSRSPVEHNGRIELWHTRLGVKAAQGDKDNEETGVDEDNPYYRTLRAIWSPDFAQSPPSPDPSNKWPFRTSLTKSDRHQIVAVTSDFRLRERAKFEPLPVRADHFMLSTLGVWMNTRGDWAPTQATGLSLEEWTHRATMARDHFVRVVYKGYLFPFGHRASLVKITERKFQRTPRGDMAAYLRQRMFVVVREQTKTFPTVDDPDRGREFPFRRVSILTRTTPNIEDPLKSGDGYVDGMNAFWVRCNGQPFQFHVAGEDYAGQRSEFSMPLVFVSVYDEYAYKEATMKGVRLNYLSSGNSARRVVNMSGQKIAYAPQKSSGDTTFETNEFFFSVRIPESQTPEHPRFYPAMERSVVGLKAVDMMASSKGSTAIEYYDVYVKTGIGGQHNKGEVFAKLSNTVQVDFAGAGSGDKSGGLITPNFAISGLSRLLGPVSGSLGSMMGNVPSPGNVAAGNFDPVEFFGSAFSKAKILGGVTLADILGFISNFQDAGSLAKVPKMLTQTLYDAADVEKKIPKEIVVTYEWTPEVKDGPDPAKPLFVASRSGGTKKATLSVFAELRVKMLPAPETSFRVTGTLENFSASLIAPIMKFLVVEFKKLSFTAGSSGKPVVDSELGDISFEGPLKFVSTLQDMIPSTGGDLVKIDVKPTGVGIGFNLALPNIEVGMFSLQNLAFSASLYLPFTGDPMRVRFAFCERNSPFLLTVSMFGGGGFFALALGLDGMEVLEAAFEFGANISLNLGLASGGVHIMAGIYYRMESKAAMLEGYLRCGGSLSVLGLITVSVEFYLSLTYITPSGKVYGQATVKVKVEVLFFSKTVSLTVERQFKGSAGDPLFHELVEPSDWEQYCSAFA